MARSRSRRPPTARRQRRAGLGLALLALAPPVLPGCALVSQKTFVAAAGTPPRIRLPPAAAPPAATPALVVIRFPSPVADWQGPLGVAVGLAVARKPDVLFTVETVVPRRGDLASQQRALVAAIADGRAVADRIVADGVDRSQVELSAVADRAATREEVRLTVR